VDALVSTGAGPGGGSLDPTKHALLTAIMKGMLDRLHHDAEQLAAQGGPTTALFTFFTDLVGEAAARKSVIDLLADAGTDVPVEAPIRGLDGAISAMLQRAQARHAIRADVTADVVLALLISTAQGAMRAEWTPATQRRVLRIVFDGLAPGPPRRHHRRAPTPTSEPSR